jgi:hypothetical protein
MQAPSRCRPFIVLIFLGLCACHQGGTDGPAQLAALPETSVQTGAWGGEAIGMDVGQDGATLEFDCAHGSVAGALWLDESGRFAAKGLYFQEHGGPINANNQPIGVDVRYEGMVIGEQMTLSVLNADTQEKIGAYSLTFGAAAHLIRCF